jgi:hypothetical protein
MYHVFLCTSNRKTWHSKRGVQGGFFGKARFCRDSPVSSLEHKGTAFDASGGRVPPASHGQPKGVARALRARVNRAIPHKKGLRGAEPDRSSKKSPLYPQTGKRTRQERGRPRPHGRRNTPVPAVKRTLNSQRPAFRAEHAKPAEESPLSVEHYPLFTVLSTDKKPASNSKFGISVHSHPRPGGRGPPRAARLSGVVRDLRARPAHDSAPFCEQKVKFGIAELLEARAAKLRR